MTDFDIWPSFTVQRFAGLSPRSGGDGAELEVRRLEESFAAADVAITLLDTAGHLHAWVFRHEQPAKGVAVSIVLMSLTGTVDVVRRRATTDAAGMVDLGPIDGLPIPTASERYRVMLSEA